MDTTLHLEIITPESRVYGEDVLSVVLPTACGEVGILPMHVPLMTLIVPGELRVKGRDGRELFLAVGEGYAQVTPSRVSVLTDMAVKEDEIDVAKAEEAVKRAQEALQAKGLSEEAERALQAAVLKSMAQLNLKNRRARR